MTRAVVLTAVVIVSGAQSGLSQITATQSTQDVAESMELRQQLTAIENCLAFFEARLCVESTATEIASAVTPVKPAKGASTVTASTSAAEPVATWIVATKRTHVGEADYVSSGTQYEQEPGGVALGCLAHYQYPGENSIGCRFEYRDVARHRSSGNDGLQITRLSMGSSRVRNIAVAS